MASTTMVHIRVDEETKIQAARTLAELGLSVSDAVRLFLRRVVIDQGMPISLHLVPTAKTLTAMQEADSIKELRFDNIEDLISDIEEKSRSEKGKASAEE